MLRVVGRRRYTMRHAILSGAAVLMLVGAVGTIGLCGVIGYCPARTALDPRLAVLREAGIGFCLIFALAVGAFAWDRRIAARSFAGTASEVTRLAGLAAAAFEGLLFARDGTIIDVNPAMCELSGITAAALTGSPLAHLIPGFGLTASPSSRPVEHALIRADGRSRPVEILWRDHAERGVKAIAVREVRRPSALAEGSDRLSRLDAITGLPNRSAFEPLLRKATALADRSATGLALLFVGIDRFKALNGALGHGAGEQILRQTVQRLAAAVRETDTVVRLGRDIFGIIQPLTGQMAAAAALADRIVTGMAVPFALDEQAVPITASVGIALYPIDGATAAELLKNAALALRQAKRNGFGTWQYFEPAANALPPTARTMEHDLRVALRQGQFSLNYQPFCDTASLAVAGYEALLRWDHPERGRIPPADFIPLAEQSGLIVPIGSWVLATACAEAATWHNPVVISVNLSPAQFIQAGLVTTVADVLRQTGLPPGRLELEITESTLMDDTQNAPTILTSLKALGVRIAMDDFGTGYSSLSYLRKFPFDKIKIDRSFISDIDDDSEAETIVQAIIAMGQRLRLEVTAEGVETRHQLSLLRAHGCDFVQGYLLGRPATGKDLNLCPQSQNRPFVAFVLPAA